MCNLVIPKKPAEIRLQMVLYALLRPVAPVGYVQAGLGLLGTAGAPILAWGQWQRRDSRGGNDPGPGMDAGGNWELPRDGRICDWGHWPGNGEKGLELGLDRSGTGETRRGLGMDSSGTGEKLVWDWGETGLGLGRDWCGTGVEQSGTGETGLGLGVEWSGTGKTGLGLGME